MTTVKLHQTFALRRVRPCHVLFLVAVIIAASNGVHLRRLTAHSRTLLLMAQELPQIPVKPLNLLTNPPIHQHVRFGSAHGPVVGDLFLPVPFLGGTQVHSEPAIILALGVRATQQPRREMLHFADTLSRLGYAVLWPRRESLDHGSDLLEEPTTFVEGFLYLETVPQVDSRRISYVGLSAGASIAFVAATDSHIVDRVHALIFFGGYFDIFDYLGSVATQRTAFEGHKSPWQPSHDLVHLLRAVLTHAGGREILQVFHASTRARAVRLLARSSAGQIRALTLLSPSRYVRTFRAHLFILHDKHDQWVPYVQSEELIQALPRSVQTTVLFSNLFQHVEPGHTPASQLPTQLLSLYAFVYRVLNDL